MSWPDKRPRHSTGLNPLTRINLVELRGFETLTPLDAKYRHSGRRQSGTLPACTSGSAQKRLTAGWLLHFSAAPGAVRCARFLVCALLVLVEEAGIDQHVFYTLVYLDPEPELPEQVTQPVTIDQFHGGSTVTGGFRLSVSGERPAAVRSRKATHCQVALGARACAAATRASMRRPEVRMFGKDVRLPLPLIPPGAPAPGSPALPPWPARTPPRSRTEARRAP